ncbi:MAG: hypothetical protein ACFFEY_14225 [Candidatus Thorarchaeota archaeon]
MIKQENICKKCILPEGFLGVQLDSNGLCGFCSDPQHKNINWSRITIDNERRKKALEDWKSIEYHMQKNHGNMPYDCILGYSGGKDSTALLDYLVNDLELTPLCITTDTGFMTNIAKENMKKTLNKFNLEHLLIESCIPTFTKLYKWHFIHHNSNEIFLARNICDYCSDLIHSIVVKEAINQEIPYVFFGYSPDQIFRYFYEIPHEEIVENWMPDLIFNDPVFDESDTKWYLTSQEINSGKIPRVLLPYHIIPYREQEIIELVESKNYIKKGYADPLLTNCNVVHAATFYDFNRYGGILYAYQYAELTRQNPESRKKWLRTLKMSAPLILNNKFKQREVNCFFEQIGVTQDEILDRISILLEKDRNKDKIKSIIKMFEGRKRIKSTSSTIQT